MSQIIALSTEETMESMLSTWEALVIARLRHAPSTHFKCLRTGIHSFFIAKSEA